MNKAILLIIFLLLTLLGSFALVFRTTIFTSRANTSGSVAYSNSYLFSSPLQAKADGKELIRISVYLLDGRGLGVPNQIVSLDTSPKVDIKSIQTTTDDTGKAVFDLSSDKSLKAIVTAINAGHELPQTVSITFY